MAGSLPTQVSGETRLHTSSLVYALDGTLQGHYHKLHLFDGMWQMGMASTGIRQFCSWRGLAGGGVTWWFGLSICYDV